MDISDRERRRGEAQTRASLTAVGHRIDDLPWGRTHSYKLIKEGKLKAKKDGRNTIVVNAAEYIASLPEYGQAA